jgi:hypothetical protein
LEFKQRVSNNYPELFTERSEEPDYTAEGAFGKKWSWYQSIYGLSQGNVTKFDEITELNLHKCLMYLAFEKDKMELEKRLIKKQ